MDFAAESHALCPARALWRLFFFSKKQDTLGIFGENWSVSIENGHRNCQFSQWWWFANSLCDKLPYEVPNSTHMFQLLVMNNHVWLLLKDALGLEPPYLSDVRGYYGRCSVQASKASKRCFAHVVQAQVRGQNLSNLWMNWACWQPPSNSSGVCTQVWPADGVTGLSFPIFLPTLREFPKFPALAQYRRLAH